MSQPTPPVETDEPILIDNHVKIYLSREVGGPWRIASATIDGCALDGADDGDYTDLDFAYLPPSVREDMDKVGLPNAEETLQLLADALEYDLVPRVAEAKDAAISRARSAGITAVDLIDPKVLADYDAWAHERSEMSESDGFDDGPTSSDWERSDDVAFELLDWLVDQVRGRHHEPPAEPPAPLSNAEQIRAAFLEHAEQMAQFALTHVALLGGKEEWSSDDEVSVANMLVELAGEFGLPSANSLEPEDLAFYREAALAIGYDRDDLGMDEED